MIHLHVWTTPNGMKPLLFAEETEIHYDLHTVDLGEDEQHRPDFLAISPNGKIPAIVDDEPLGGGEPVAVFESGAILLYLAERFDAFLPDTVRGRIEATEWLFWQVGGLGPMAGQLNHFEKAAKERLPYAIDRFQGETERLYGVLDRRLDEREFVAGHDYSIADMAIFPWIVPHERQRIDLGDYPSIERWFEATRRRPAVERAYALAREINPDAIAPPVGGEEESDAPA